ncbi:hypothetical protein BDAP_001744 [Binucleata daphniae]
MLNFLNTYNQNCTDIYSFGRITEIRDTKYIVSYKKTSFLLVNVKNIYKIGEWIRFYGFLNNKTVNVKYTESLCGLDLNIYESYIKNIILYKTKDK